MHDALTARRDAARRLTEQEVDHRQVVRAEAPQRVLVTTDPAEPDAGRGQVAQRAERAGSHQVAQPDDRGVEQHEVTDHRDPTGDPRRARERDGARRVHGERLLDQHVLARRERGGGERGVGARRRRDHDGVDRRIGEDGGGVTHDRHRGELVDPRGDARVGIGDRDQPATRLGGDHADVVDAPRAGAEHGDP